MSGSIRQVTIAGRVQGVGYRAWVEDRARALGVEGWVRNRRDGSVEAVFGGSRELVSEMIASCKRGPSSARVDVVRGRGRQPRRSRICAGPASGFRCCLRLRSGTIEKPMTKLKFSGRTLFAAMLALQTVAKPRGVQEWKNLCRFWNFFPRWEWNLFTLSRLVVQCSFGGLNGRRHSHNPNTFGHQQQADFGSFS